MKPLIEVRSNRYYNLIVIPFAAGLGYLFFWLSFISDDPPFEDDALGRILLVVFVFVALLICILAIRTFLKNKSLFIVYEDGFVTNTHGVASQKVLWRDISRIEDKIVPNSESRPERVLAIFFKDPDYFAYSKSKTVGKMMRMATIAKGVAQGDVPETEAPLLIPGGSLGEKFEEIKSFIEKHI